MFSFFRRGKSKDDGEKKEKSKEKSSLSPFSKRQPQPQDSSKRDSPVSSPTRQTFRVHSFTTEATNCDTETQKNTFEDILQDEDTPNNDDNCAISTQYTNKEQSNPNEGVHGYVEPPLADSPEDKEAPFNSLNSCFSPLADPEPDRGGSSERETVYKTAPNTPVLQKHLAVADELPVDRSDTDASDIVTDSPEPRPRDSDLPCAPAQSAVSDKDHEDSIRGSLETCSGVPGEKECPVKEDPRECEEMSHVPGQLYDIAEEESSEDEAEAEDRSEEEEDDDEDDDDEDSGNVTQPTIEEEYPEEVVKRNHVNHHEGVDDLTKLCGSELEYNRFLVQIEDLQRDVMVKTGGMDRLQAELNAAHKESELVRKKVKKLENDLESLKQKNSELMEEIQKRSEGFDFNHLLELEEQVAELTKRMKQLEGQLEQIRQERDRLKKETEDLQTTKAEEKRIIQEALDEALAQKKAIQSRFERDFEKLRTVNTDREQQLLDDFEWKLREVEQACKRRLEEKEKTSKLRIKDLEDKLKAVENDLAQVDSLRHFEAEANQLRGLNLEQQRALRLAERTKEELQVSEKILREEVKKMKELLEKEKSALTTMQAIHNREIDEKDRKLRFRLEQQKNELNSQWEEKLRKETLQLRVELDQINRDEKRVALEVARAEKQAELNQEREKWEKKVHDLLKEVDTMKHKITDKEEEHKKHIESIRTTADRDIFDLRRKLDRIDLVYEGKIENMKRDHEREKERLLEESERKLQGCEQSYQLQLGSTRATLELVKEQLKREAADQLQALHENHRRQLEEQWEQLVQERDEMVAEMEARHRAASEKMRADLEAAYKCQNTREKELVDLVNKMRHDITEKNILIKGLSTKAETLKDNVEQLSNEITSQDEQFQQTKAETETKLRLLEDGHQRASLDLSATHQKELDHLRNLSEDLQAKVAELTKRLEEKQETKLVEDLKKSLSEKENQVAQLSKEKHLYQLEVMNRNCHGSPANVTARQRRKGGRGKTNKAGPSRK